MSWVLFICWSLFGAIILAGERVNKFDFCMCWVTLLAQLLFQALGA